MARNTLVWRPTPDEPPPTGEVPDELANLLFAWLREHDVWLASKPTRDEPLRLEADDERTIGFLEGLAAMNVTAASGMLTNLIGHKSIDLWWE
jgi:hypothetical protein